MEIKLTKNQDGTYDKVELVDAELENGSVVQIVNSRETLDDKAFEAIADQINALQIERSDVIKLQDQALADTLAFKDAETARIDALLAPLLALKAKHDETKADVVVK
jgi:hypothetical protein